MTRNLLLAITVLAAVTAGAAPARAQGADVAQLVRDACIETGLDRAAFERLARERRWRSVRLDAQSGGMTWRVAYRVDGAIVTLMSSPAPGQASAQATACTVSINGASAGLADQIDNLATSLGLASEGAVDVSAGMVPIRVWSHWREATLTLAAAPDGRAIISFSRPYVVPDSDG